MKINLKQIEAFVWVADLGSFARAGERLRTTQPNISTRVANLEDAIGIKLLERDAGSVRLTDHGKRLLKDARAILKSTESFIESTGQNKLQDGLIRIGITELIVNTWLPLFLAEAKKAFPALSIELTVDLSANLKTALFARSIDIAFQNGPFSRKTSGSKSLGTYPYVWVGTPEQPICKHKQPSLEDMRQMPILTHGRDTQQYQEVLAHFTGNRRSQANLIPCNSISPSLQMTLAGVGISALPAAMVREHVSNGSLKTIPYRWTPKPLSFLARYEKETAPLVSQQIAVLASAIAKAHPKALDS